MRRSTPSITRSLLAGGPALLLSIAAWAQPAPTAEAWDDTHMRSSQARLLEGAAPRPPIQIGEVAPPGTRVQETILSVSPHAWKPGGPSHGSGASSRLGSSTSTPSSGSSFATRTGGVRTTTTLRATSGRTSHTR